MSNVISQEIKKMTKLIMESIGVEDYSSEDFIEVAVIYFRDWVKEKYGEKVSKYPISYLNKKYGQELVDEFILKFDTYKGAISDYHGHINFRNLGIKLIENSLFSFVDVSDNKSWFDYPNNVKIWDKMVKFLNLPPYLTLNVTESRPRYIEVQGNIDYDSFVKSDIELKYSSLDTLLSKMRDFLKKYAGQKFGNPAHGQLRISKKGYEGDYNFIGFDNWEKNVFNKKLKPEIKKLPIAPYIRTIVCKFTDDKYRVMPKIIIWRNRNTSFTRYDEIEREIKLYLTNNGYNIKNLPVDFK